MPPDTRAYYWAAYVILTALYTGYAVSVWWRGRRVRDARRDPAP